MCVCVWQITQPSAWSNMMLLSGNTFRERASTTIALPRAGDWFVGSVLVDLLRYTGGQCIGCAEVWAFCSYGFIFRRLRISSVVEMHTCHRGREVMRASCDAPGRTSVETIWRLKKLS